MIYEIFKDINPLIFSSFYFNQKNKKNNKVFIKFFFYNFLKLAIKQFIFFIAQKYINKKYNLKNYNNFFFSVTNKKSFTKEDEFFGNFYKKFDHKMLIIIDIKINKTTNKSSISLLAQLSLIDFLEIILNQYKILKKFYKNNPDKRNELLCFFYEIKNLINIYSISKIITKISNDSNIYYIFENEPWERALLVSLSYYNRNTNAYAFTHTLISRNNDNYNNINILNSLNAIPLKIITTGRYNLENLLETSKIDVKKNNLSIYHTNINKLNKDIRANSKKEKKILFLIDDTKYLNSLYNIMIKLIKENSFKIIFSYNEHDKILDNEIKSRDFSLMNKLDLKKINYTDVSIVIYNSTSFALEFYKQGYHLSYFNFFNNLKYDPLYKTNYNKTSFRSSLDILKIYENYKIDIDKIKLNKEFLKYFGNNVNFKFKKINYI